MTFFAPEYDGGARGHWTAQAAAAAHDEATAHMEELVAAHLAAVITPVARAWSEVWMTFDRQPIAVVKKDGSVGRRECSTTEALYRAVELVEETICEAVDWLGVIEDVEGGRERWKTFAHAHLGRLCTAAWEAGFTPAALDAYRRGRAASELCRAENIARYYGSET